MTLNDFADIVGDRIPTPYEFLAFVNGAGWKVVTDGDAACLRVRSKGDPLAVALARMLAREPYRTQVLRLVQSEPPAETAPAPDRIPTRPREEPPQYPEPLDSGPHDAICRECRASVTVWDNDPATVYTLCGREACPYRPNEHTPPSGLAIALAADRERAAYQQSGAEPYRMPGVRRPPTPHRAESCLPPGDRIESEEAA